MKYSYNFSVYENGVSVTTYTKSQKHVTVTILGGVETVTREPHTTQKQVEYTRDFANQIFSNQWGSILTFH